MKIGDTNMHCIDKICERKYNILLVLTELNFIRRMFTLTRF